jgi:hypothetical protein
METRDPHELDRHEAHQDIYGDEDFPQDFVESVAQDQQTPITINEDDTIIDGYRRVQAAVQKDTDEVFVRVRPFDSVDEETEAMIHSNKHRVKTFSQKMAEAQTLKRIEEKKAKARQGTRNDLSQKFAQSELGSTNEKVAENYDWSSTTFDHAEKVWNAAQNGHEQMQRQVEQIDVGNQTIHGAWKTYKKWEKTRDLDSRVDWDQIRTAGGTDSIDNRQDTFNKLEDKATSHDNWRESLNILLDGHEKIHSSPGQGDAYVYGYMIEANDHVEFSGSGVGQPDSLVDKHPGKDALWDLYWDDEMDFVEIALALGVHEDLVRHWLYDEKIPVRKQDLSTVIQNRVD